MPQPVGKDVGATIAYLGFDIFGDRAMPIEWFEP